jgi:hypothetical protein
MASPHSLPRRRSTCAGSTRGRFSLSAAWPWPSLSWSSGTRWNRASPREPRIRSPPPPKLRTSLVSPPLTLTRPLPAEASRRPARQRGGQGEVQGTDGERNPSWLHPGSPVVFSGGLLGGRGPGRSRSLSTRAKGHRGFSFLCGADGAAAERLCCRSPAEMQPAGAAARAPRRPWNRGESELLQPSQTQIDRSRARTPQRRSRYSTPPSRAGSYEAALIQGDDHRWYGDKLDIAKQIGNAIPAGLGPSLAGCHLRMSGSRGLPRGCPSVASGEMRPGQRPEVVLSVGVG